MDIYVMENGVSSIITVCFTVSQLKSSSVKCFANRRIGSLLLKTCYNIHHNLFIILAVVQLWCALDLNGRWCWIVLHI